MHFQQKVPGGEDPWAVPLFGLEPLRKKLKVIGIQVTLSAIAAMR